MKKDWNEDQNYSAGHLSLWAESDIETPIENTSWRGIQEASASLCVVKKQRKTFREYYKAPNQAGSLGSLGPDWENRIALLETFLQTPHPRGLVADLDGTPLFTDTPEVQLMSFQLPACVLSSAAHQRQATSRHLLCHWTDTSPTNIIFSNTDANATWTWKDKLGVISRCQSTHIYVQVPDPVTLSAVRFSHLLLILKNKTKQKNLRFINKISDNGCIVFTLDMHILRTFQY